jgi:hypothetical protein
MDVDPLASMRCWVVTVELGGREYEIPALPAVDWWPVLADGDLSSVVGMIRSTDRSEDDRMDEMILDGTLSGKDLSQALTDAVEEVTGRSLYVSTVLAVMAVNNWPVVGGELAKSGFRWDVQPIGAALDAIHAVFLAGLGDEARKEYLALLEKDTATGRPNQRHQDRITAEFETMAGPRPAPAPVPGRASGEPSGSSRSRTRTRPRQPRQDGRSGAPKQRP